VVLTHNLLTNCQLETARCAAPLAETDGASDALNHSLRFALLNRAAQRARPQGALRLRLMNNLETRQSYERVARALAPAA
jgi:hypothetical protein